jgi:dolichyl-phosphate-mannose-protein mannosyltransferase
MNKRWATGLAAAQIAAIFVFGVLTAFRFPIWSPIDEQAHFNYIQSLVENKRLPVLKRDLASPEVRSLAAKTYPSLPPPLEPVELGPGEYRPLEDYNYEAHQPPLYYLAAIPAFVLHPDFATKVVLVRLFDLALLLAGAALFGLLCRSVFPEDPWSPFAFGLVVFASPGTVVRGVMVSNATLEIPLTMLLLIFLWRAYRREGVRDLLIAGVVLGLCLLTKETLIYLWVIFALVVAAKLWRERTWKTALICVWTLLLPLVMLLPWLAFNVAHFGAATANQVGKEMVIPIMNPGRANIGIRDLTGSAANLFSFLPSEWSKETLRPSIYLTRDFVTATLFLLPVAVAILALRRLRGFHFLLFGLPLVLQTAMIVAITVVEDVSLMDGRFLISSIVLWTLFAFAVYKDVVGSELLVRAITVFSTLATLGIWTALAVRMY